MSAAVATTRAHNREQWEDAVSHTFTPLEIAGAANRFDGVIRTLEVGHGTALSEIAHPGCTVSRTARGIRRSDSDSLYLSINRAATMHVAQAGRSLTLQRGAAAFYISSLPYMLEYPSGTRQLVLQVSRHALPLAQRAQLNSLARPLHTASIEVGILQAFLEGLLETPESSIAATADVIHQTTLDLTALTIQAALAEDRGASLDHDGLFAAACAAIRTEAGDPHLDPGALAARFHVSRRLLYQVFEANGTSPAVEIRAERLRRAAALLMRSDLPVGEVAARTGFFDLATFGRAFRREFGRLPSQWRRSRAID